MLITCGEVPGQRRKDRPQAGGLVKRGLREVDVRGPVEGND